MLISYSRDQSSLVVYNNYMQLSLLTYNILFNRALSKLKPALKELAPTIICLQEIETKENSLLELTKLGYKLAGSSNSFIKFGQIFGLATYYDPKKLVLLKSESFDLPRSFIEALFVILRGGNNPRSVLKAEFRVKKNNKKIVVFNIHLSAWGSNGVRLRQINEALESLELSKDECPILIAGDFNFSYRRKRLEEIIRRYSLLEATNALLFTLESKILGFIPVRLKLDYILFRNLKLIKTTKIPLRFSDHFPILSVFRL